MYIQKITFPLLLLFWMICSCTEEKSTNTQICVLIDVTDEGFKENNFGAANLPGLLKIMKLDKNSGGFSGGEIKLSLINDVSDSKSKIVKIAPGKTGMMGENPLTRKDEVNRFYAELEKSFASLLNSVEWGTQSSKIYQKIARESIRMKRKESDQKYLIIFSDMLENSDLFSFYRAGWEAKIGKMIKDPEATLKMLSENGPALPDLSEFQIYVISSRTRENDEKINLSEQLWGTLFEYQGATVHFNSSLEI